MKSKIRRPPLYLIIILLFSITIAFVVFIQLENDLYSPQHRSCSSIDFTTRACSTEVDVRFDFLNSRDARITIIRINGNLEGDMEVGRTLSTRVPITNSYKIEPYVEGFACPREVVTIVHDDITRC
ncbi:MAG: hypothetical protein ACMXYB_00730 [Candidatus Woesearchaeota archaeon]